LLSEITRVELKSVSIVDLRDMKVGYDCTTLGGRMFGLTAR
jgi:hypothetical protein